MSLKRISYKKIIFMIMIVVSTFTLLGCGQQEEDPILVDGYTVIYDGNGGYLGNKTYTYRKLQVAANSKIPKYPAEYSEDPYVVSSLGLANRIGYSLEGWYLEEDAVYTLDPTGRYVYLDNEEGNGAYMTAEGGDFVYTYVEDEAGDYVFIYVEPLSVDDDQDTQEFVYLDQGPSGSGFYKYDSDDVDHSVSYVELGSYMLSDLNKYGAQYFFFEDFTDDEKVLFADSIKSIRTFIPYTDEYIGQVRYNYQSAYISLETIFQSDSYGEYVLEGLEYVLYDETNPAHENLNHYKIDDRYNFTATEEVANPGDLERYVADFTYWDFENQRVTEDITLYAHWVKKLTVEYVQMSGQITYITTKALPGNVGYTDLVAGETIGEIGTIPVFEGYTFAGWSTTENEYTPWDFENDVYPENTTTLRLYGFMIEGDWTRISSAAQLANVANDPSGNYLLANDIDLDGEIFYNESPTGFEVGTSVGDTVVPFTGEFNGLGNTISNYTIVVSNAQKAITADQGIEVILGFFPAVENAAISNLNLDDTTILLSTSKNATAVLCDFGGAALIGEALAGTTTVDNVTVDVTFTTNSTNVSDKPVYIGDIVAKGFANVTASNVTSTYDYTAVDGITTDTFNVQFLN